MSVEYVDKPEDLEVAKTLSLAASHKSRVPHRAELLEAIFFRFGGMNAFADDVVKLVKGRRHVDSKTKKVTTQKPHPNVRARIISDILRLVHQQSESVPGTEELGHLTEEDLKKAHKDLLKYGTTA